MAQISPLLSPILSALILSSFLGFWSGLTTITAISDHQGDTLPWPTNNKQSEDFKVFTVIKLLKYIKLHIK